MKKVLVGMTVATLALAAPLPAQEAGPFDAEITARQGIMAYRAINLGVLGAMAKGEAAYDASAAQTAADNLVSAARLDTSMLWPQGSDNSANPMSRADAKAWTAEANLGEKNQAFMTAAEAMQGAAGNGLDALKAAIGPLGEACGACHKAARIPNG